ncbi:50S ribosomal protein L13 [Anaerocellum diazotrophicum]|uniref:Large ribosomal subunit protein uL13 n=1 Tax=Caldicellulosiruptor diazotrophicus TaxID=2806205 RepID=A0ABM7NKC3_9FIRM|nr:50S ribosomal protein L13 [Caldicellulosiruptor diazotrophicus]BCS80566.1 50S ribosomal protein L13 [Caldicellulosiruptor diazotrophicus]
MKTYLAKPNEVPKKWYVIDATGKPLGRLAAKIAVILRGKHKPQFTPNVDTGDYVIVVNAEKVVLTGKKLDNDGYRYHTKYPGGLKFIPYRRLLEKHPEKAIEIAVRGMLPKNRLRDRFMRKLKVYRGPNHPHAAQKPEVLEI